MALLPLPALPPGARRDAAGDLLTLDRAGPFPVGPRRHRRGRSADPRAGTPTDGPYLLQARIAACHATAPAADRTDWPTIARWYDELARLRPTPVIGLNRAVAHGYAYGPAAGLALLAAARAGGALDGYPPPWRWRRS